jgi:hypothetical protein
LSHIISSFTNNKNSSEELHAFGLRISAALTDTVETISAGFIFTKIFIVRQLDFTAAATLLIFTFCFIHEVPIQ